MLACLCLLALLKFTDTYPVNRQLILQFYILYFIHYQFLTGTVAHMEAVNNVACHSLAVKSAGVLGELPLPCLLSWFTPLVSLTNN